MMFLNQRIKPATQLVSVTINTQALGLPPTNNWLRPRATVEQVVQSRRVLGHDT